MTRSRCFTQKPRCNVSLKPPIRSRDVQDYAKPVYTHPIPPVCMPPRISLGDAGWTMKSRGNSDRSNSRRFDVPICARQEQHVTLACDGEATVVHIVTKWFCTSHLLGFEIQPIKDPVYYDMISSRKPRKRNAVPRTSQLQADLDVYCRRSR